MRLQVLLSMVLAVCLLSSKRVVCSAFVFPKSFATSVGRRSIMSSSSLAATNISFDSSIASPTNVDTTVLVGKKSVLQDMLVADIIPSSLGLDDVDQETRIAVMSSIDGTSGSASTFTKSNQLMLCALPDKVTRNNHPMSVHKVTELLSSIPSKGNARILFAGAPPQYQAALAASVAKAFPVYSKKSSNNKEERSIQVNFVDKTGNTDADEASLRAAEAVATGVQLAARLVDMPPAELTTDAYAEECRKVADELDGRVTMKEIVGSELDEQGYGGLYGVGKAAECPPRLVIMEYKPENPTKTVALVGKGIVYDTGGLSLKPKTGMCGMKHDMGGSAGMLGGFYSAVKLGTDKHIVLILCLAENAIGPTAFRNDDILTMYSGKTVEVNNCDAEGRLVLGDGVAHATKHIDGLDLVVDMATLTGAQLVATGKKHAGILANTEELEKEAVAAGLHSGDLVFPLLYAPELLKDEFSSKVADMKNSVKDRSNAQTSCAGHFIESHLDKDYSGGWLHVDMAGPASKNERGTGYGVGLICSLLEAPGF